MDRFACGIEIGSGKSRPIPIVDFDLDGKPTRFHEYLQAGSSESMAATQSIDAVRLRDHPAPPCIDFANRRLYSEIIIVRYLLLTGDAPLVRDRYNREAS